MIIGQDEQPNLHMRFSFPNHVSLKPKRIEELRERLNEELDNSVRKIKVSDNLVTMTLIRRRNEQKIVKLVKEIMNDFM